MNDTERLEAFLTVRDTAVSLDRLTDRAAKATGLKAPVLELLLRLHAHPAGRVRMTALADQLGITTGGMTRLADRAVLAGLVYRRDVETDERGYFLVLTQGGRAKAVAALTHVLAERDGDWAQRLADRASIVRDHIGPAEAVPA